MKKALHNEKKLMKVTLLSFALGAVFSNCANAQTGISAKTDGTHNYQVTAPIVVNDSDNYRAIGIDAYSTAADNKTFITTGDGDLVIEAQGDNYGVYGIQSSTANGNTTGHAEVRVLTNNMTITGTSANNYTSGLILGQGANIFIDASGDVVIDVSGKAGAEGIIAAASQGTTNARITSQNNTIKSSGEGIYVYGYNTVVTLNALSGSNTISGNYGVISWDANVPQLAAGDAILNAKKDNVVRGKVAAIYTKGGVKNAAVTLNAEHDNRIFADQYGVLTVQNSIVDITSGNDTVIEAPDAVYVNDGSVSIVSTNANKINGRLVARNEGKISIGSENDAIEGTFEKVTANSEVILTGSIIADSEGSITVLANGGEITGNTVGLNDGETRLALTEGTVFTGATAVNAADAAALEDTAVDAYYTGLQLSTTDQKDGSVRVVIQDSDSVWNVTKNSSVTELVASDGTVNIAYGDAYKRVTTGMLTADNAVVMLKHDISSETDTDQLAVTGKASGSVTPVITVTGTADADQVKGLAWLISQGDGSSLSAASTAQVNTQNGGVQQWKLAFFTEESTDSSNADGADTSGTGNDAGYWYLVRATEDPVTPVNPVTPEVSSLLSGAVSLGQATAWAEEIEDLRMRLGEVREDGETGAWVRVKGYRERFKTAGNGFKQHVRGVHIGADSRIGEDGWFAGAAFRYANANQDSVIEGTEGDTHLYSLKGYATKLWENGSYFDAVVQIGRYDHTVTGYANDLQNKYSADYNGWGFGLSAEIGRKIRFGENTDTWYRDTFIEPQAQLSYQQIRGKDFTTSTGMQVSQDNAKFVTGRLGVVAGKEFRHDDGRFFQMNALAGVKRLFKGDQTVSFLGTDGASARIKAVDIAGTRVYYGVSFNWVPKKNIRAYGEFRREQGDSYVKDYEVNLGVRYVF